MTLALPAAALAGRPGVGTFHHVHRPLSGRAAARERLAVEVATRSKAAIFVSQASLTSFADRYRPGRRVPKSWTVVHNGIDLDYFSPATEASPSLPADLGLSESAPPGGHRVVTLLAALRDFKGITHAVRAWPDVLARVPEARLLLVGSGSEEASLRAQVADLGLTESVVFAGMRSDIPEILRASEVVLLPSIYGENLPTVLMEAGGCGRPVVASDVGGISDIVADRETGLLVRPGDAAGHRRRRGPAARRPGPGRGDGPRGSAADGAAVRRPRLGREPAPGLRDGDGQQPAGGDRVSAQDPGPAERPVVVVVAEATPMRGGIATFAETITADPRLAQDFDMRLLNTARVASRQGGRFNLSNVWYAAGRRLAGRAGRSVGRHRAPAAGRRPRAADAAGRGAEPGRGAPAGPGWWPTCTPPWATPVDRSSPHYGRLDRLALRTLVPRRPGLHGLRRRHRRRCGGWPAERRSRRWTTPSRSSEFAVTGADRTPPTVLFIGVICRRKGTLELARAGQPPARARDHRLAAGRGGRQGPDAGARVRRDRRRVRGGGVGRVPGRSGVRRADQGPAGARPTCSCCRPTWRASRSRSSRPWPPASRSSGPPSAPCPT